MAALIKRINTIIIAMFSVLLLQSQNISFSTNTVDDNFDGPGGIFMSDINADGFKDIIAAGIDANTIAWWKNDGTNQEIWEKHIIVEGFSGAMYVSAADIDNDGLFDVLGAAYNGNEIAWWHNDGGDTIQWTKQTLDSEFLHAHEIMAYDIDKDGDMDVLGVSAGLNVITWYENDGNYPVSWIRHVIAISFAGARSVDAGDIDGDGDIDIAGAALDDNEVAWWRNDGGYPIEWTKFSINTNFMLSHKVQISDIDLDGDNDILGTAYSSGISWWRNDGGDTISWEKQYVSGNNSLVIAWAVDLDLDTDMDIIGSAQNSGYIAFWENEGNNSLDWDFNYMENFEGAWPLYYGDLDNDGDDDLVCGGRDANEIRWYRNDVLTKLDDGINTTYKTLGLRCYPTPANKELNIDYELNSSSAVKIQIFDLTGKLIADLIDIEQLRGNHSTIWKRTDNKGDMVQPGIYFCRLQSKYNSIVRKVILVN